MRRTVGVLLLVAIAAFPASGAATPEALFDLGMRAFRAADYASAVADLRAAADAFATSTDRAVSYQTALVYLALAQFRSGREDEARDTILRLVEAERATPVFATLPLDTDAADFQALVAALVPDAALPRNPQLAIDDPTVALPTVRPATPPAAEPTTAEATRPAIEAATEVRVEEIQQETDRRIAAIQAEADRRIAEVQAEADRRIAAAQADADRRIAAAEADAERRIAAAQAAANARVAAAEADARQRIAAAEQQAEREADARIAAMERPPASTPQTTESPAPSPGVTLTGSAALTTLRQAEELAAAGDLVAADALYVRLANDPNVPREVLAESAVGLYRIGSYEASVAAFRRMGAFARGEEDLRYYFAVSLYESGAYRDAQRELACALPFIEITDDVARYRLKIEQSAVTIAGNL